MTYKTEVAERVEKRLKRVPKKDREQIDKKIKSLSRNPRPQGFKKLKGENPPLYRIRSGVYRIIYKIEDGILFILVVEVEHRKDVKAYG